VPGVLFIDEVCFTCKQSTITSTNKSTGPHARYRVFHLPQPRP
jgi:hypothetical protein